MRRQLVVVVHGVGVRQAGASTDMVASALAETGTGGTGTRFVPHSSDDFLLHEHPRHDRAGIRRTFPARIRRYRRWEPGDPPRLAAERVLADFYWGDISATGADLPRLALGFLKIVLGLSHVIRESACEVFPRDTPHDSTLRRIAAAAPLVLHGPILAINLILLAGFVVHAGLAWALASTLATCTGVGFCTRLTPLAPLAAALTGVGAMAVAALGLARAASYLERLTWRSLAGAGLAAVLLGLAGSFGRIAPGLDALAQVLVGLVLALWALAFALAAAAGAAAWLRRRSDPATPPALILPGFGLMTVLWFATLAAVWALLLQALQGAGIVAAADPATATIRTALSGVLPALPAWFEPATDLAMAALAALAAALFVWLRGPFAQGLAIVTDIVVWLND